MTPLKTPLLQAAYDHAKTATEELLRSEIDDVRRERDRCLDALQQIYAEYGEDQRIAGICDPLIQEFPR